MVGQWCLVTEASKSENEYERRDCRSPGRSMTLDRKHVFYMEDGCDFTRVKEIDHNVFYIHSSCGGEGMTNESAVFQLLPNDRIRISHHSLQ
jgi:hypothetical protein